MNNNLEDSITKFEEAIKVELYDVFLDGEYIEQVLAANELEAYRNACNSLDGWKGYDPELVSVVKSDV